MKKSFSFWFAIFLFLSIPLGINAQDDNPYDAMPIMDIDGNTYKVIMSEEGVWMAENLKTTRFNDGKAIPQNKNKVAWEAWSSVKSPMYGWHSSDPKYRETYGAMYNWHAVGTGKLCPKGWHVPTEKEWNDLMDYAGSSQKSGDNPSKLKESGTTHWKSPNKGAANAIHFNALPAGEVSYFNTDEEPGTMTTWWTSSEDLNDVSSEPKTSPANALIIGLSYDFQSKTVGTYQKESALPVRCKMDD